MGSRYRCRVSPSGVPGCGAGSGGTGDVESLDLVGAAGGEFTLAPDESAEIVSGEVTLDEDGEIAVWFTTNQVVTGAGAGAQRFTYIILLDGSPVAQPPRIMDGENDFTVSVSDTAVIAADAGTHTVSIVANYDGGGGVATVDSARLTLLGLS